METYYDKNGVIVRDSTPTDVAYLQNTMRQSDINEIWASHHTTPREALLSGLRGEICMTVQNGKPLAMFGINSVNYMDKIATIWFLADDDFMKLKFEFVKHSRRFVDLMFHKTNYYMFCNYVDARNKKSIKWLKSIGANVVPARPFGADQLLFHFFSFRRPDYV